MNNITNQIPEFFYLKKIAINRIENINSNNYTTSYIKLLLFNVKDKGGYEIYNASKDLSISYLFVVSGLHINVLTLIINRLLFKVKNNKVKNIVNILISIFLIYFLQFSISMLRILVNQIIKLFRNEVDLLNSNYLSGLIILFIFNGEVINYGFMMSYFCSIIIIYIIKKVDNKFLLSILINLVCILITLPFIAIMNKKINIYSFFYNYIYSWIILVHFFWFLIFGWFEFSINVNYFLVINVLKMININLSTSLFLNLTWWNNNTTTIYFSTALLASHFINWFL